MNKENETIKTDKTMAYDTLLCPVIYDGREFYGIEQFDCHVTKLFTEETLQGTFMTVIPISDIDYRKENPTKAKIEITDDGDWTFFDIFCNWGNLHTMRIHKSLSKEIKTAKKSAADMQLL